MATYNKPSVGSVIHVRITNIVESLGAFARMPDGHDGLIRLNDFAWFNQVNILKSFSIGDELDVKVIKELPDGKLNLSRKELLPNPRTVEKGLIFKCIIKRVENYGLIVQLGDFTALVPRKELPIPIISYKVGDAINCVILDNVYDSEKHYNKVSMSVVALHNYIAAQHQDGDVVKGLYTGQIFEKDKLYAVIEFDSMITLNVSVNRFIEPYKTQLRNNAISIGDELLFAFSYDEELKSITLDMRPIKRKRLDEEKSRLCAQLNKGDIIEAEVLSVNDKGAKVRIMNTEIEFVLPREELSPNKVIRASDEVFVGEHIRIAYLGEGDRLSFSRRFFVKDKYDEKLYDLSLQELLFTMGLTTNKFIGKLMEINSNYFMTNLMTIGETNDEDNGKLLIDPINGKTLIVLVSNRLRNFFTEDGYYEVELDLAAKEYRLREGTPYMFHVVSNRITKVKDPYKESVFLAFKQHTSPNTNTSVANLLEEVGKNLYSSKKRMFFELLQNADDAASQNGVKVKLQIKGQYFVLTHDGYAFNLHDFESITSAAKSTKRANDKKTGYKGIGFKSVFTNSHTVYITSGGFSFSFNKECPIYNSFDEFYFLVNDIDGDLEKQKDFLKKYSKYKREFNGVKDIPWQLLPIWTDNTSLSGGGSIFSNKENVSIALKMDEDTLVEYSDSIKEVFNEPRFMLFLRNTNRVQLICDNECLTIQKNKSDDGKTISLVNSFNTDNRIENYTILTFDHLEVNDGAFLAAGVPIQRKERRNNRGEKENYLARIDANGKIIGEVSGIPDRIASTKDTTISFAIRLNSDGHIAPLGNDTLSLYAYLPMNEFRFKFPFYINADFIPKSDREGVQSDNPWNHFIFYTIGKLIVSMVGKIASIDEPEYLNLLPTNEFLSSSQDTAALVDAFNRGYKEALASENIIINDTKELVKAKDVIFDSSGLAKAIGAKAFYELTATTKHLVHPDINSELLSKDIFNVEECTVETALTIINSNKDTVNKWIKSTADDLRYKFFEWVKQSKNTQLLIPTIPAFMFGNEWKCLYEISIDKKILILTEKLMPIKDILFKLGFQVSSQTIENHPFYSLIPKQEEKSIFTKISQSELFSLSSEDKLKLFITCSHFSEIGFETLRKWKIFKNQNGEYAPLGNMFSYRQNCPTWLYSFMLSKEDCNIALEKYWVKDSDVFSLIEQNVDALLAVTSITTIYSTFSGRWKGDFTLSLFSKIGLDELLPIVEQSDSKVKFYFIRYTKAINLYSSNIYGTNTFEYRWLQLATLNSESINHARNVISIDGKRLSDYTIKDEVSIDFDGGRHSFSLSELVPSSTLTSILSSVVDQFSSINNYDKIFAQNEADITEVMRMLSNYLKSNSAFITAEQFCFLIAYYRKFGRSNFDNSIRPYIRLNNESVFLNILEKAMSMNIGKTLGVFISNGGINYPFEKLVNTYFDCDEYTLESERIPEFIKRWAGSKEKKQFLKDIGLHDNQSSEMQRRKSFKDKKNENIWNLNDAKVIQAFFNWVAASFALPIVNENQVLILHSLHKALGHCMLYYAEDFTDTTEWNNRLYFEWKKESNIKICIVDGELPCRGMYNNTYLFKDYEGEYTYFPNDRTIYISSNKEFASILANVYSDQKLRCPFTKDDWNKIFLVSATVIEEKDKRIAELEATLKEAKKQLSLSNDEKSEMENHGLRHGRGNLSPEQRKQVNLEACEQAFNYLNGNDDFDCSEWDYSTEGRVVKSVLFKGHKIVVVITSSNAGYIYLNPYAFAQLMQNPDNLLVNVKGDEVRTYSFKTLFEENKDVNLIFDADVVNPETFADLANKFMTSKNTSFVVPNPNYSVSEAIEGFGLHEKMDNGKVLTFSLDDLTW